MEDTKTLLDEKIKEYLWLINVEYMPTIKLVYPEFPIIDGVKINSKKTLLHKEDIQKLLKKLDEEINNLHNKLLEENYLAINTWKNRYKLIKQSKPKSSFNKKLACVDKLLNRQAQKTWTDTFFSLLDNSKENRNKYLQLRNYLLPSDNGLFPSEIKGCNQKNFDYITEVFAPIIIIIKVDKFTKEYSMRNKSGSLPEYLIKISPDKETCLAILLKCIEYEKIDLLKDTEYFKKNKLSVIQLIEEISKIHKRVYFPTETPNTRGTQYQLYLAEKEAEQIPEKIKMSILPALLTQKHKIREEDEKKYPLNIINKLYLPKDNQHQKIIDTIQKSGIRAYIDTKDIVIKYIKTILTYYEPIILQQYAKAMIKKTENETAITTNVKPPKIPEAKQVRVIKENKIITDNMLMQRAIINKNTKSYKGLKEEWVRFTSYNSKYHTKSIKDMKTKLLQNRKDKKGYKYPLLKNLWDSNPDTTPQTLKALVEKKLEELQLDIREAVMQESICETLLTYKPKNQMQNI